MKEKIIDITFSQSPDVRIRVIDNNDTKVQKENKKEYPFELYNTIDVTVVTNKRTFCFSIFNGYTWNGADIPRFFWRIIGSRTDNDYLIASMLHDYLLEFKTYIVCEVLGHTMTMREYRRLTTLIFRHIIKSQGTNVIKANVMAWCVDVFQMCNRKAWTCH